ncbi:DNA metabolism protein [Gramella sp. BOM4]|nr:DNA metabolism protein [Christiangramia bathymodioli]
MSQVTLIYDGSFNGFLSCIFRIYEEKIQPVAILPVGEEQQDIFSERWEITTNESYSTRVLKGIQDRLSGNGFNKIKYAFLSELPGVEMQLYKMLDYMFSTNNKVEGDYSNPHVLKIAQIAKKVGREKHRMEAFVRFRLTRDRLYFALIEPDFNVLPLIAPHFKSRYADQKWMIYDQKRKFGIYYDLDKVDFISIKLPEDIGFSGANQKYFDIAEIHFQQLWKEYFISTNIKSRANKRLHEQHVPKRYWKYLSEKSPFA